jgi:hypothetical protein
MKTLITLTAIILLNMIAVSSSAQNNNRSQQDENRRIRRGVCSGELTAAEMYRLKLQQAQLKAEAYRYKQNDGHIGPLERADLRRDNRQLSRNIYRQKHDGQTRF